MRASEKRSHLIESESSLRGPGIYNNLPPERRGDRRKVKHKMRMLFALMLLFCQAKSGPAKFKPTHQIGVDVAHSFNTSIPISFCVSLRLSSSHSLPPNMPL